MSAKWNGLTAPEIAASLRNRAAYFRTAEGGWRDDTADLLDTAAACVRGLLRMQATKAELKQRVMPDPHMIASGDPREAREVERHQREEEA